MNTRAVEELIAHIGQFNFRLEQERQMKNVPYRIYMWCGDSWFASNHRATFDGKFEDAMRFLRRNSTEFDDAWFGYYDTSGRLNDVLDAR